MTIRDSFQSALANLAPFRGQTERIELVAGDLRLTCELVALESLAGAFQRLALESPRLAGASVERLHQVGQSLAGRLTYLLEPIRPIEVDPAQCVVQLRSNPPQKDEDATSYYELLVRSLGEISLCRYTKAPGEQRRVVPTHVTLEVLLRLVGDFATVLS